MTAHWSQHPYPQQRWKPSGSPLAPRHAGTSTLGKGNIYTAPSPAPQGTAWHACPAPPDHTSRRCCWAFCSRYCLSRTRSQSCCQRCASWASAGLGGCRFPRGTAGALWEHLLAPLRPARGGQEARPCSQRLWRRGGAACLLFRGRQWRAPSAFKKGQSEEQAGSCSLACLPVPSQEGSNSREGARAGYATANPGH